MLQSVIAIILVLGLLIFFHELGHFLVARMLGIGVSTFSLGFGPRIFGFKPGKTEYRLSAVPLGGYVHLVGETAEAELPPGFKTSESFALRSPWQRILVVSAGPIFNFVLAWLIYWGIFWANGQIQILPEVGQVAENSPAQVAGLKSGDMILKVNGQDVEYWDDLAKAIRQSKGAPLRLQVQRDKGVIELMVKPKITKRRNIFGEKILVPQIGITASGRTVSIPLSWSEAARTGLVQTWTLIKLTLEGLIKLIERIIPLDTIGGPIMIAKLVSDQAHQGLINVLALTALISINLGLLNLLPIPVLDGGHILFYTIEIIIGRPLDQRLQKITTKIGLSFLIALMGLAVVNDILRFFK
jgi:regulator of sigma E protease